MATQLMQQLPCKQEQQVSQTMHSQTQHASILCQFPAMPPRSWPVARRPSSPGPALYDVHHHHNNNNNNNNSSSEGSQLSHGVPSQATTGTAAAPGDGDASWEVRAFAEDSASCSGQWPPRSYACSFCRREFRTAQALGGHMNVHRRERAQANNMAMLRSTAQQAAAAAIASATPQQLTAVAGPQGAQWCIYSPMGVNTAAIASPEKRAFFYSNLAPGGAIIAMTNSSGDSSQFTSRSSPGPSPSQYNKRGASNENQKNAAMFTSAQISPSSPSSPMSSPISPQGSLGSGSSVITSQGEGGGTPYRSISSVSEDSASFAQKLQLGAFQPYQSSLFANETAPLVTQELIQLRPQHHSSTLFSKSMVVRGPADDVGFLDLELRLGPAC